MNNAELLVTRYNALVLAGKAPQAALSEIELVAPLKRQYRELLLKVDTKPEIE